MEAIYCSVNLFITPKFIQAELANVCCINFYDIFSTNRFLKESLLQMFSSLSIFIHKKNSMTVPSRYSNESLFYRKSELLLVLNYGNLNVSLKLFRFELRSILGTAY